MLRSLELHPDGNVSVFNSVQLLLFIAALCRQCKEFGGSNAMTSRMLLSDDSFINCCVGISTYPVTKFGLAKIA